MTGQHGHPDWTTCLHCGKRSYRSRKEAKAAARTESLPGMSAYECHSQPGAWHIGHLPAGVANGRYARSTLSRHHARRRRFA